MCGLKELPIAMALPKQKEVHIMEPKTILQFLFSATISFATLLFALKMYFESSQQEAEVPVKNNSNESE